MSCFQPCTDWHKQKGRVLPMSGTGLWVWNLNFVRPLNDWEVDDAQRFLCLLNSKRVKH